MAPTCLTSSLASDPFLRDNAKLQGTSFPWPGDVEVKAQNGNLDYETKTHMGHNGPKRAWHGKALEAV